MTPSELIIPLIYGIIIGGVWFGITKYIQKKGLFSEYVTIGSWLEMYVKTKNVNFLDSLIKSTTVTKIYKYSTIIGLFLCYVFMFFGVILTIFAVYLSVAAPHLPNKINAPNNILMIPGVTDFVPLTVEVIISLLFLVTIHEIAHGILGRVHGVKIKSAGAILLCIPVGGFVELDEDELNVLPVMGKLQIFAAGITANLMTMVVGLISTVYLISLTTGVAIIKSSPLETVMFWWQSLFSFTVLPILNILSPVSQTLWITQTTSLWLATHTEPFFGYLFLLHLSFWTFWVSFALVFTNTLPLKITDGGQIFEVTSKYLLDKVNLGRYASGLSTNIAIGVLICVCGTFFIPYIYQFIITFTGG